MIFLWQTCETDWNLIFFFCDGCDRGGSDAGGRFLSHAIQFESLSFTPNSFDRASINAVLRCRSKISWL
jgi:hypothetical protein